MASELQFPLGWVAACDPSSGRTYYANPLTGETSWTLPVLSPCLDPLLLREDEESFIGDYDGGGMSDVDREHPDDAGSYDKSRSSYQTHHESAKSYQTNHENETLYQTEHERESPDLTQIDAESALSGDDNSMKKKGLLLAFFLVFAVAAKKLWNLTKRQKDQENVRVDGEVDHGGNLMNTDLQIQEIAKMPVPPADP